MKLLFSIFALIFLTRVSSSIFDATLDNHWKNFKQQHKKSYKNNEEETNRRLIWEANLKYINKHNNEASLLKHTFTLGMNKFGDLTNIEYARMYNNFKMNIKTNNMNLYKPDPNFEIPSSIDWRKKGAVSRVKDEGQCGGCWAFSAVDAIECAHFLNTGKLVELSEQNLLDCSYSQGNQGCTGGFMDQAYQYVIKNKGIDTLESYPYSGSDGKCHFNRSTVGATITSYKDIKSGSEVDLTSAVASIGVVSVAVDASQSSFQFYQSGVYSDKECSSTQVDHSLSVVGYGSLNGTDYYICKNMWTISWGDQGYILIGRNMNNMCGIATVASYPIV